MVLSIYVRPLHAHHRQEHNRKTVRRSLLHRAALVRLDANLQRRAVTTPPIIRTHAPDRIELAKWGFVREDWKNSRIRSQNNARLETADEKPMFRDSFRARHCLVIADSFYEWKTLANGAKQPYRIMLKSGEPFAMAGIYARSRDYELGEAENTTVTFAILTTTANEIMQPIHDRMPVILPLHHEKRWLPSNPSGMFVFPAFPPELMTAYPVTPKMNKASFNEPQAIAPLDDVIAA
jgi:putative SOS response-associated peptidase YedK